ncbi:MAG: DUF2344 domain-containing protein [Sedimentisphaerales bacterium]|nr:DUF2344 domain-containing protein [Sedimentisphaerales bacterium]
MFIGDSGRIITIAVRFRIFGDMRFLSHSQTLRFFQRACVRADMELYYSRGFNPRPKLSLPLPRNVGVESEDELLCVKVNANGDEADCEDILKKLKSQMTDGVELLSAEILTDNRVFGKGAVAYRIDINQENEKELDERIRDLLNKDSVKVKRQANTKSKGKEVEIRSYLKSLEQKDNKIIIDCIFGPAGTIRVDEILGLLGLKMEQLAGPVKRLKIIWQ